MNKEIKIEVLIKSPDHIDLRYQVNLARHLTEEEYKKEIQEFMRRWHLCRRAA